MPDPEAGEVTGLLRAWHAGDEDAYRRVSSMLYNELRRQAAQCMRLTDAHQVDWQDRKHFLAVAGRTMRRVLVDLARERDAVKRGAGAAHVPLESNVAAGVPSIVDLVALDKALENLAAIDARKVRVVELRFFAGLTVEETAQVLEVSPDTVARDWRMARTWLLRELVTASK